MVTYLYDVEIDKEIPRDILTPRRLGLGGFARVLLGFGWVWGGFRVGLLWV